MATATSERVELAKHCSSRNWSKAIRVLDSLLAKQSSILDIWFVSRSFFSHQFLWIGIIVNQLGIFGFSNRAFCYNQLELHKHVIKDCDKALLLEPCAIQAFILKG